MTPEKYGLLVVVAEIILATQVSYALSVSRICVIAIKMTKNDKTTKDG